VGRQSQAVEEFTHLRKDHRHLGRRKELKLTNEVDKSGTGPAGFMVGDPDGDPAFINQHVQSVISLICLRRALTAMRSVAG
jgi:lactoylglutathione lyase